MDLPTSMTEPAALGPEVLGMSAGLGIAVAGCVLAASCAVFIFERRSVELTRSLRLLVRICAAVLLVLGVSLFEQFLLAHWLGAPPFVASMLGAALVVVALLVAVRARAGAGLLRAQAPSGRSASSIGPAHGSSPGDWRWLVQLAEMTGLTELQHFIVERLTGVVRARVGGILLADSADASFKIAYSTIERGLFEALTTLPSDAPLLAAARKRPRPILRAALAAGNRRRDAGVLRDLETLGAELAVPLASRGRVLGMAVFGECLDEDGYDEAAIERAMLEAEVMAAVIENARVHALALQDKFRADVLLEQLTLGVLAADESGTIVACNRAARRILALERSPEGRPVKAFGPAMAGLLGPETAGTHQDAAREMVFDVAGRGEVPVRVRTAVVRGPLDAPGHLLLIEDLSERRALESELRRARQLASVGTLAAEMAHEIRNPLVSIKTFSQLLPERLNDQQFQLKFAQIARREVDAISRIIDRLLNVAGPSASVRRPVDLEVLAAEVLELLAPEIQAQQIAVETDFAPGSPPVLVDCDRVKQVVRNVVTNAVQAMPAGGRLRIAGSTQTEEASSVPTACRMIVEDTGCGIAGEDLASVFDPFFTTKERGFGLGLSLARNVMDEHGGSIEIESEPGRGTCVTLTLPLASSVKNVERSAFHA